MKQFVSIVLTFFLLGNLFAENLDNFARYRLKAINARDRGLYDSSLFYLNQARIKAENYQDSILCNISFSRTYYKLTDFYTSKIYLDSALEKSKLNQNAFLPYILHNQGLLLTETGNFKSGLHFLIKALDNMPDNSKGAVLNDIGRGYRYIGSIDSSSYYLQEAYNYKLRKFGKNNYSTLLSAFELIHNTNDKQLIDNIKQPVIDLNNNYLLGLFYFYSKDYLKAEEFLSNDWFKLLLIYNNSGQYIKAVSVLDSLRDSYLDIESKLFRQEKERLIYKLAIDQAIKEDTLKAFKIALKSRGNLLREDFGKLSDSFPASYNYFDFDSVIYLFHINSHINFYKIKSDSIFDNNLNTLINCIQFENAYKSYYQNYKQFCESAFFLNKKLLPVIEDEMNIIPDGRLHVIPFEALLTKIPSDTSEPDFKTLPYLFLKSDIHYDYILNTHSPVAGRCSITLLAPDVSLSNSQRLAKKLKRRYKGNFYQGGKALLKYIYTNRILHIDTHYNPEIGYVKLADSLLYIDSVKHLPKDLVVLATCYSGKGRNYKGEGIFSLGRKFYKAGANSVIESSWASDDVSSYAILNRFYYYLQKGQNKSTALINAKIDYLNTYPAYKSHPSFWSNLRVFGNNYPIKVKLVYPQYLILLITLICIIVFLKYTFRIFRK